MFFASPAFKDSDIIFTIPLIKYPDAYIDSYCGQSGGSNMSIKEHVNQLITHTTERLNTLIRDYPKAMKSGDRDKYHKKIAEYTKLTDEIINLSMLIDVWINKAAKYPSQDLSFKEDQIQTLKNELDKKREDFMKKTNKIKELNTKFIMFNH